MQIRGLHKTVYRLYAYARTQECLDAYRQRYEGKVRDWESLKAEGVGDADVGNLSGFPVPPIIVTGGCCGTLNGA